MAAPLTEIRVRAQEAAEALLQDYRDRLDPHQYERALTLSRRSVRAIHPAAAAAMLRLYVRVAGVRV